MLLAHDEIEEILDLNIVEYAEKDLINAASLDIRLGFEILVERPLPTYDPKDSNLGLRQVTLRDRDPLNMISHNLMNEGPFFLYPGEFILAHSHEVFNLPNHISASYALKSSMARIGLEHLNAGWCDAGWNGSSLTLELKNITRYHIIVLHHLDKIGQMIFMKHKAVKHEHSYATRGRYNGDRGVSGTKADLVPNEEEVQELFNRGLLISSGEGKKMESKIIKRVMLDLETTGKSAGCGILCIGATTFDKQHKFYERITPASCRTPGLKDDMDTMRWWQKQDPQLREEAFGGTKDLVAVLDSFHNWFRSLDRENWKGIEIWGNGADFDLPILKAAYEAVDRPLPWGPYSGRCYRTLKNLLKHVEAPARASKKHHALDDAIYQAEHASLLLQVL